MSTSAIIILQKTRRVAELLEERIGVKGETLAVQLGRARWVLSRDVRTAAQRIARAESRARNGGVVEIDHHVFDDDYRHVLRFLQGVQPGSANRALWWGVLQGGMTALMSGMILGIGLAYVGVF